MTAASLLRRHPELTLVAVTCIWASTFIVTEGVLTGAPPLPYLALRFGLGAGLMFALFPRAAYAAVTDRRLLADGAVLAVGQTGGVLLQVFGQVYTTASKAAFLTSLCTALTPLIGYALYRERPRRRQIGGLVLASTGLALLTFPRAGARFNPGDLLALAGAVVYAWVIVETARRARRRDPAVLATVQVGVSALLMMVALVASQVALRVLPPPAWPELLVLESAPFHVDAAMAARIAYMAVVATVLAFLGQLWAMARMNATRAAVVFALEPLLAIVLALAIGGAAEWPGVGGAIGAAAILAGLLVAETRSHAERRAGVQDRTR